MQKNPNAKNIKIFVYELLIFLKNFPCDFAWTTYWLSAYDVP